MNVDPYLLIIARQIVRQKHFSVSWLKRTYKFGDNRAGLVTDQLEKLKIIGPFTGDRAREILVKEPSEVERLIQAA